MRAWFARVVFFLLAVTMLLSPNGSAGTSANAADTGAVVGEAATSAPHSVSYDRHSLLIDGKHVYIWSGEFHYWRLPSPGLWRDVLEKLHAQGYNAVSIYFDWAYHSSAPGHYDFHGVRDVDLLLDIAAHAGLYVIARPGPYINAETDSGGFPGWVETQKGLARTSAPDFLAAARDWYRHIDPIIARHQLPDGRGSVILYQVENEYIGKTTDRAYMAALERQARADGIVVPFTHNSCCGDGGRWSTGVGAVDINGYDSYPQGFDCTHPDKWDIYDPAGEFADTRKALGPNKPFFLTEYQGGSDDPWGGPGYDACRALTDSAFERVFEESNIAVGASLQNFYMGYGGTSWGWLPSAEAVYTSYDYGAGIDEARHLNSKYDMQKLLGFEIQTLAPLATAETEATPHGSNPAIRIDARLDKATRTQIFIARHADIVASTPVSGTFNAHIDGRLYAIPVTLNGRDSKMIVAGYTLGTQHLVYTTSEIMTTQRIGDRDVAVLFGRAGETGDALFHFARGGARHAETIMHEGTAADGTPMTQPTSFRSSDGQRAGTPNLSIGVDNGDFRVHYRYGEISEVLISTGAPGTRPLDLLIGSDAAAATFWPQPAHGAQTLLVRGPNLVRSTTVVNGDTLGMIGDTSASTHLEVYVPSTIKHFTWNGIAIDAQLRSRGGNSNVYEATLTGPQPVGVPELTDWKRRAGSPESAAAFDDSSWERADHTVTNNPNIPFMTPVLYADDYGFHYGDVWYRGHFISTRMPKSMTIDAGTGRGGTYSVWINGTFIGAKDADMDGRALATFDIPSGTLQRNAPATIAVLLENMGHNEDFSHTDSHKSVRGIRALAFTGRGAQPKIGWRIAGNRENDPVRGPLNAGGQFGERAGWYLPGYDDAAWEPVVVPSTHKGAGVAWYRTQFALHLPADEDVSLGVRIDDTPARPYRSLIYVNGWLIGRFVNNVGPQTRFVIPNGILRTNGLNTLAISSWNQDPHGTDLGTVSLEVLNAVSSTLTVPPVESPTYQAIFARQ